MINELPDLAKEDLKYNLHANPVEPATYNLTLVFPNWTPPAPQPKLMGGKEIKNNLKKIGIFL